MSDEDKRVNELLERNGKIKLARKYLKLEDELKEKDNKIKQLISTLNELERNLNFILTIIEYTNNKMKEK